MLIGYSELLHRLRARAKPWSNRMYTVFIIKFHDATALHHDLRILDGRRLVSWALHVRPSLTPGLRRIAVRVKDHDPEYALIERRVPKGKYGAGPMLVWDVGFLIHTTMINGEIVPFEHALQNRYVEFWTEGFRICGGFSLEQVGDADSWVLTKLNDEGVNH